MTRGDSTALRWLIGGELARLRDRSGLSMADVAKSTGLPKTKINHMENARTAQRPDEVKLVLKACNATETDIQRLVVAASTPYSKPWWAPWRRLLADWNTLYLGLEGFASKVFTYEAAVVPGLLQTHDYAADITSQSPRVSPDDVERFVSLRQFRAERLFDDPPLICHAVLDEAALHRRLTNKSTMIEQCEHLLEVGTHPNITIQIIKTDREAHGGMTMGNYSILDFENLSGVAYSELYVDALFTHNPDKVASYRSAATHLCDIALSPSESQRFIEQLRRGLS